MVSTHVKEISYIRTIHAHTKRKEQRTAHGGLPVSKAKKLEKEKQEETN